MMDNGQQQETPPTPSLAEAKAELANLDTWLKQFATMQQQLINVQIRTGYLQGVVATYERPALNREQRRTAAKKVIKKSR